ncbi:hypothetical protein CA607_10725 [Caulobacter vibrioides]|nr:hypothetical protein CA607_10725 [Caulobacter vibrioides]
MFRAVRPHRRGGCRGRCGPDRKRVERPEVLSAVERLACSEFRSVNAPVEVLLREASKRRGVHPKSSGGAEEP